MLGSAWFRLIKRRPGAVHPSCCRAADEKKAATKQCQRGGDVKVALRQPRHHAEAQHHAVADGSIPKQLAFLIRGSALSCCELGLSPRLLLISGKCLNLISQQPRQMSRHDIVKMRHMLCQTMANVEICRDIASHRAH